MEGGEFTLVFCCSLKKLQTGVPNGRTREGQVYERRFNQQKPHHDSDVAFLLSRKFIFDCPVTNCLITILWLKSKI